jgi:hypothetical protein
VFLILDIKLTTPITGPYTDTNYSYNGPGNPNFEVYREWYRQRKPFNLPLAYTYRKRHMTERSHQKTVGCGDMSPTTWQEADINDLPVSVDENSAIYNEVYKRFKNALGDQVQLGVALAEGREAMNMMSNRLFQVARFTHQFARGRFGEAATTLGLSRPPRGLPNTHRGLARNYSDPSSRERIRDLSSLYLEFHFGWSPLMKDIHEAAEALSSPYLPHRIYATYNLPWSDDYFEEGHDPSTDMYHKIEIKRAYRQKIAMRADMSVSNPNLALASQLGLINPATIGWELVPFSFVLDWFANVGDFLSSFTDFAGIDLSNQQRTVFTRLQFYQRNLAVFQTSQPIQQSPNCNNSNSGRQNWVDLCRGYGIYCRRMTGAFPGPTLRIRDPWVLSPRRGLAAASLLFQRFPRQLVEEGRSGYSRKRSPFRNGVLPEHFWTN